MYLSKKQKRKIIYVTGSIAAAAIALLLLPKVISAASAFAYKKLPRTRDEPDDDDWGPEIVKTSTLKKEN